MGPFYSKETDYLFVNQMDNCGHVRMDRYWNFIALPSFVGILLFGLYILFTTDEVQFATSSQLDTMTRSLVAEQTTTVATKTKA